MIQEKKTQVPNSISTETTQATWSNTKLSVEERKREGARQFKENTEKLWNIYDDDVMSAWERIDMTQFYRLLNRTHILDQRRGRKKPMLMNLPKLWKGNVIQK